MKLRTVEPLFFIENGGIRAAACMRRADEALRQAADLIGMAHQNALLRIQPFEKTGSCIQNGACHTVFTLRAGRNLSPHDMAKQLRAVANTPNRDAKLKKGAVTPRRLRQINALRTARENNADRVHFF